MSCTHIVLQTANNQNEYSTASHQNDAYDLNNERECCFLAKVDNPKILGDSKVCTNVVRSFKHLLMMLVTLRSSNQHLINTFQELVFSPFGLLNGFPYYNYLSYVSRTYRYLQGSFRIFYFSGQMNVTDFVAFKTVGKSDDAEFLVAIHPVYPPTDTSAYTSGFQTYPTEMFS